MNNPVRINQVILAIILMVLIGVPHAGQLQAAELTGQEQAQRGVLSPGKDNFLFNGWAGPAFRAWTYIPPNADRRSAPILFVMHGARRDPQRYREEWIEEANTGGFIVIAPEFSSEDFRGSRGYNLGALFERDSTALRPETLWSYSAIEPLFDEVVARIGGTQTHYTIFGHSAGSQFVHRFLLIKPDTRAKRYLAANAGWYTFADFGIEFPFGLKGTPAGEASLRAALAKDVVILLGDQDTDPDHRSLNRSDGAMRQGPHRFARGQAFFAEAKAMAKAKGWKFGWSLRVIKGVAHSNDGMAAGSYDLVD